ncbi:ParB/RepB/Spo0J family partition protein [Thiohalobacter thiocyanaticus]|uniref:Probable chromosome-partitioning protein ParB n=1 Tax=Thiohalobacter thiocyanaticus TaxID=585455 RepID=A0A426QJR8_9GAMM|nr:ParB/RepB/Spo0J family partition protein [Thiohalobacter thiocyanaticus]RRQ21956.1 ParB/RepB/Spo0J family partition protein [Thiohalobacter thiocyanaticus]
MATKKRGLGRGLDALLGSSKAAGTPAAAAGEAAVAAQAPDREGLRELPVDLIQRGKYQPRQDMHTESLQDLADSISAQGVVQPIVVRPIGGEGNQTRYEIIAGERRWRAAQLAGLQEIPAVVRDVPDRAAIAMALIENIQRENLNPMEEARALQRLLQEFEMTHQQAAEAVGRSRTSVTNLLRLLELNEDVRQLVEAGKLEMGHARALLGAGGATQSELARTVISRGLSVRETERLVKRHQGDPGSGRKPPAPAADPDTRRLEQDLAERLGADVKLQAGKGGKGRLVISFNSLDELDGILDHIK